MTTARTDQHTGIIPPGGSLRWGMGKVNAYRAIAEALGVVSVPDLASGAIPIWPNPTEREAYIQLDQARPYHLRLLDAAGRVVLEQRGTSGLVRLDLSDTAIGPYAVELITGDDRRIARLVKH